MLIIRKKALRYSASILLYLIANVFEVQANDTSIEIDIGEEGISVTAQKEKLSEVLIQLGNLSDIEVTGADTIDVMFDGRILSRDVEELLKMLGVNSILVWDDSGSDRKLREMILLSVSQEGSSFLPAGEAEAAATANNEVASQQQLGAEPNLNSQIEEVSAKPVVDVTNPDSSNSVDSETTPGFGFSIDPNSVTINPQQ